MNDRDPADHQPADHQAADHPSPEASYAVDGGALPWRSSPYPGVEWKKLFFDAVTGESAVLLKFEPGAHYGTHQHPGGEEYLVLEGSLDEGEVRYGPGSYVRHPAGSVHRPRSEEGCVVFVRLPHPILEV